MFLPFIFDPEVVNGECELNGSGYVLPEAGRVRDLEVSKGHISRRSGSFCRRLYFVMDSPVVGWMTAKHSG